MKLQQMARLAEVRELVASGEAKRRRLQAGFSLSEVASACGGVDPSTIWRWECGLRVPRGDAALAYAQVLELLDRPKGRAS